MLKSTEHKKEDLMNLEFHGESLNKTHKEQHKQIFLEQTKFQYQI